MRNCFVLILVVTLLFLSGCATNSPSHVNENEQIDLYLSTLDDKHFVWCKLNLTQCRTDFENWKITSRGRAIIREYEQEQAGPIYNTHHVPNIFRTQFVDDGPLIEREENILPEGITASSEKLGPQVPSNY